MAQMNMQQMMKQARKMQEQLAAAQETIAQSTVDASAGGGMVKVTVSGDMQVTSLKIDPEAIDPEDVEMLEDMVMAAVNEALRGVGELANRQMGAVTGGLNIPGMLFNGCFWTSRVARNSTRVLPANSFAKDTALLGSLRNNR